MINSTVKLTALIAIFVVTSITDTVSARGRMFHPVQGRFIQRDPIGTAYQPPMSRNVSDSRFTQPDSAMQYNDGMSLYQYEKCSPRRFNDPSGLLSILGLDINEQEIDYTSTETMSDATAPSYNNTYESDVRFSIHSGGLAGYCYVMYEVKIKLNKSVPQNVLGSWYKQIFETFHKKCEVCCSRSLPKNCGWTPIVAYMTIVNSGEHQNITVEDSTKNSLTWGADSNAIAHEFGHLLGFDDEYYTVNGIPYGEPYQPDGNVMNNPDNLILSDQQCDKLAKQLGSDCTGKKR